MVTGMRWHLTRLRTRGIILAILMAVALPVLAEPVVIGNLSSSVKSLTLDEVRALYLGQTRTLRDAGSVDLADRQSDSAIFREFYEKVTEKDSRQIKALWAKLGFMGKAKPPKVFDSDEDIKAWIKKHPNAIGYIEKSSLDKSVNVLLVID
mgnify:CR=1 FL=1